MCYNTATWLKSLHGGSVRFVKKAVRGRGTEGAEGGGVWPGEGACPSPENLLLFFISTVHSGAFSYTDSKVLFAIKCKERYVIMVFLAIDSDTDRKTSSFH